VVSGRLTAVVDGNVSGRVLHKVVVRRRRRVGRRVRRGAEGVAEEVDRVALAAESDVGAHRCGHPDVGMAQQLLDHDELHSLLQEEGGRRVAEVVKADAAYACQRAASPAVGGRGRGGSKSRRAQWWWVSSLS
jgi:hypothetical protein